MRRRSMNSSPVRTIVALILTWWIAVSTAPTAAASCAGPPEPATAPVSFVGTVIETAGPYVRFDVAGQGSGPALAPQVWVLGGVEPQGWPWSLLGAAGFSSVDLRPHEGQVYAVGAYREGGGLTTSICASSPVGAREDPPAELVARAPEVDGLRGQEPPLNPWIYTGPALALLLALGGWALFRRRT